MDEKAYPISIRFFGSVAVLSGSNAMLGGGSEELIVLSVDKFSDYFIVNFF